MSALFTIILPHRRNPGNDAALKICLDCLMQNTRNDFILLMDAADNKPLYPRVNAMVRQATTECCVYTASDTFVAPGWDEPMLELWTSDVFVTSVLVEPGAIGVYEGNVTRDFGRKPDQFRRDDFEAWTTSSDAYVPSPEGWPCLYMFPRSGWIANGGLEENLAGDWRGFTPADERLWARWKLGGKKILRARSFAYHLQSYSEPEEQQHGKRG